MCISCFLLLNGSLRINSQKKGLAGTELQLEGTSSAVEPICSRPTWRHKFRWGWEKSNLWRLPCSLCLHTHSVSQKLHFNAHFVPSESNAMPRPITHRRTRTCQKDALLCDVLTAGPKLQMEMHFPLAHVQCERLQCRFWTNPSGIGHGCLWGSRTLKLGEGMLSIYLDFPTFPQLTSPWARWA